MADMDIFTHHPSPPSLWSSTLASAGAKWLVVDANWSPAGISAWFTAARENPCRVAFEPVSVAKATRIFSHTLGVWPEQSIDLATPNNYELAAMYTAAREGGYLDAKEWFGVIDALGMRGARDRFVHLTNTALTDAGIPQQTVQLLPYIPTILTKLGSRGVLLTTLLPQNDARLRDRVSDRYILARSDSRESAVGGVYMRLFAAAEEVPEGGVVSVNGVGDTFHGVLVAGMAVEGGRGVEELVGVAQRGAVMTLRCAESVSGELGRVRGEVDGVY